jgi:hypothetical protein
VTQQPMQIQNTEENQQLDQNSVVMYPNIDENVPIPKNARDALPDLTNEEEVEMLANTVKLIADLTGQQIQATQDDVMEAKTIAETMIKNPENKIQLKKYKSPVLASLAGMVAELNSDKIVEDLKDLKTFVVNGLIREATTADKPKERITALRAIGEVDGVDAFKKHTEVVHTSMSLDDIEEKLKVLVNKIQRRVDEKETQVIDAEIVKDE